jgi:hypothetical protein
MAIDPVRLSNRARPLFALAAVVALILMGLAGTFQATFSHREYDETGSSKHVVRGSSYLVATEVFGYENRMVGHWYSNPRNAPDEVILVAGSDVRRILAGQEPEHLYGRFPSWGPGAWVGDVNFVVPEFTCRGPQGGCEDGDLPTMVFTKGTAWRGTSYASLQQGNGGQAHLDLVVHDDYIQPLLLWMAGLATAAVLVSLASGTTWWMAARRSPKGLANAMPTKPPIETSLQLVHLSRLYLGSMARSLYLGGGLMLVALVAVQFWVLPDFEERFQEAYTPMGPDWVDAWFGAVHWLIVPYAFLVALVFWIRNLRQLRAEQRRWESISGRLADLERQVLG